MHGPLVLGFAGTKIYFLAVQSDAKNHDRGPLGQTSVLNSAEVVSANRNKNDKKSHI